MTIFQTLLWREFRDHRATLGVMLIAGPLLVAMMQGPFDFSKVTDITAKFLIPGIVLIFSGVFGGDLITREEKDGISLNFSSLPIPKRRAYLAKLAMLVLATILIWTWLVACETFRLWVLEDEAGVFFRAAGDNITMLGIAMLIGLGAFSIAPWVGGGLSSLLGVLLIILLPVFFMGPAEVEALGFLAPITMAWTLTTWLWAVAVALIVAGYFAWRTRTKTGERSALLRIRSYVLGGSFVLLAAGSASAAQHWCANHLFYSRFPVAWACSFSPDGRFFATCMTPELSMLDLGKPKGSIGHWPNAVIEKVGAEQMLERYLSQEIRVYDLATGERLVTLDGYSDTRWIGDESFAMTRYIPELGQWASRRWSTETLSFVSDPVLTSTNSHRISFINNTRAAWDRPGGGTLGIVQNQGSLAGEIALFDADGNLEFVLDSLWEPGLTGTLGKKLSGYFQHKPKGEPRGCLIRSDN